MGDLVLLSVSMHRAVLLLLIITVSGVFGKRKFCPRERNGDKCRAEPNTFKCGVFFYDLIGKGGYQYLAELPQALHKTSKEHWQEIVGKELDSCDRNVLVSKADQTVGDYLCGQVRRWLKKDASFIAAGKRDINIRFRYSFCSNDWVDVADQEKGLLVPEEPLCCTTGGKFERCDGTPFRTACKC